MAETKSLPPNDSKLLTLEEWCQREQISAANARGYYLPKGRIPGAEQIGGCWYVPSKSTLVRRRKQPRSKTPKKEVTRRGDPQAA